MENVPFDLPVCMIENPNLCVKTSVVDRHRFDANPDPDPTFYSLSRSRSGFRCT
jgi:hypothetical protein